MWIGVDYLILYTFRPQRIYYACLIKIIYLYSLYFSWIYNIKTYNDYKYLLPLNIALINHPLIHINSTSFPPRSAAPPASRTRAHPATVPSRRPPSGIAPIHRRPPNIRSVDRRRARSAAGSSSTWGPCTAPCGSAGDTFGGSCRSKKNQSISDYSNQEEKEPLRLITKTQRLPLEYHLSLLAGWRPCTVRS